MKKLQQEIETERLIQMEIMEEAIRIIRRFLTEQSVIYEQGRLIRKALRFLEGAKR